MDQKRKWCREIKRLMLESYSSKIPENVKDLIMQKLGQSKEEEGKWNFTPGTKFFMLNSAEHEIYFAHKC